MGVGDYNNWWNKQPSYLLPRFTDTHCSINVVPKSNRNSEGPNISIPTAMGWNQIVVFDKKTALKIKKFKILSANHLVTIQIVAPLTRSFGKLVAAGVSGEKFSLSSSAVGVLEECRVTDMKIWSRADEKSGSPVEVEIVLTGDLVSREADANVDAGVDAVETEQIAAFDQVVMASEFFPRQDFIEFMPFALSLELHRGYADFNSKRVVRNGSVELQQSNTAVIADLIEGCRNVRNHDGITYINIADIVHVESSDYNVYWKYREGGFDTGKITSILDFKLQKKLTLAEAYARGYDAPEAE
jgi:hypothetical protein